MYCRQEIEMSDRDGKWLPYNKTGTPHECRKESEKQDTKGHETDGLEKKVATIDGIAALDLIPYINNDHIISFVVGEYKGAKIVEVYSDE